MTENKDDAKPEKRDGHGFGLELIFTLIMMLGVFVTGFYAGRYTLPKNLASVFLPVPAPTASQPAREPTAGQLLARVTQTVREATRAEEDLGEKAKEEKVKYSLLRRQGYAEDSPVCRRVVSRYKELQASLTRVQTELKRARQLEDRLVTVIDRQRPGNRMPTLDPALHREALIFLQGHDRPEDREVIPSEQWDGGGDNLMQNR